MSQSHDAWVEVGEHLKTLGATLKRHYQEQQVSQRPETASREEVKDAIKTLSDSVAAAFGTIGDAVTDPEVTAEARETAGVFLEALGASFSELGADVSKRGDTADRDVPETSGEAEPWTPQPAAPEDRPGLNRA